MKPPLIILTAQRAWVYRKYPPFGALYVAGALADAGFRVKVVHEVDDRKAAVARAVREEKPLFLGLSVIHTPLMKEDIEISREAHEAGVTVVWGGIFPSMVPETALSADYVDYVITGEAEQSAVEFARALQGGRRPEDVPGVGFKDRGQLVIRPCDRFHNDLDAFRPAWELIKLPGYLEIYAGGPERMAMVPLSRGCPMRCAFCYNQSSPERRRYRIHSEEWVLKQLGFIKECTGANAVRWIGDNPFSNPERGRSVISAAGMPWISAARIEIMDPEFCTWLAESGCRMVGFGFESGSNKVLEIIRKGVTKEQMRTGIENLARAGVNSSASWIHLIPGETDDDRRETREFMDELYNMSSHLWHDIQGLRVYPGTPLWERALKMGMEPPQTNEDWAGWNNRIAPLLGWTEKRLRRLVTMTRLLYGRTRAADSVVPGWARPILRRRFIRGRFPGPLEERLAKRPSLTPYLTEN